MALAAALAGTGVAHAQVSVPLPGAAASPRPDSAPPPQQSGSTIVTLPGAPPPQQAGSTTVGLPGVPQPPKVPIGPYGRPDINPYDRDIEMTVPLTYRNHPLGEVSIVLTHDDRFIVDTQSFLHLIDTLLNDSGQVKLKQALGDRTRFGPEDLAATGISLEYDPGSLSVVVLTIEPAARATESLFQTPRHGNDTIDLQPTSFSAFLNINAVEDRNWGGFSSGFRDPSFYFNGAARLYGVVLESDFQLAQNPFGGSESGYRLDRSYVRAVYDEPDKFRRWYLGDLSPDTRGGQSYVQMAGIGVSRQRNRFDQFRSAILQGNRQLLLQRASTVEIYRNGTLYQQFRLEPGAYDLSALPLTTGSNDIQVQVKDDAGAVQTINYQSYLDPIDLAPGDYEYAAYIGKVADRFGLSPTYGGGMAFTGYYRKAFLNHPALGVGLQASRRVQIVTGQTQFVLPNGGRLQLDAGGSNSKGFGQGASAGVGYDQIFNRNDLTDSFTIQASYFTKRYAALGVDIPNNSGSLSVSAQYTRALNNELTLLFGGTYLKSRQKIGDSYRAYANVSYRLSQKWLIQGGVDYTRYPGVGKPGSLGFMISLTFQPNYRDRAELRHDDSLGETQLSYTHASSNRIGSLGYGGIVSKAPDSVTGQAYVDYNGSRFNAALSQSAYGSNFGHITDQQVTSLRVGTSLAFAGGHFGIGPRVNDSFALIYPHETLKGHAVVAGQSLSANEYLSKSGALGAAVNGYLTSYVTQSIQYDVENPPPGYDIGPGVVRVRPPYHSGYALKIGTDAFASAMGTLEYRDGTPVTLVAGRVAARDGKDKKPIEFFTNSVGRFAIQNLRPGVIYNVELYGLDTTFEFTVPGDTKGLVDLKAIKLAIAK